jgi:hypothetical protein
MGGFAPLTDVTTGRASHWNAKNGRAQVDTSNITNKIREAFEVYMPNVAGSNWSEVRAPGDLTYADGNAAAASYLVVSKDPLVAGQQTTIESTFNFTLPVEFAFGVSMSQRTLGQEFAIEIVDTGELLPTPADLAIASITQATTTLTVETTTAHGLSVGQAIGIRDCSNQLANYPALVVATTPSPVVFTATAGPGGTIASQTITNPVGAKGFVYFRERLGRAQNGVSQIFENATVTNASLYIRSENGDALPSGTVAGNQSVTIGTTASIQLAGAVAYQYSFSPTTEYRVMAQTDRTQWADVPVDSTAAMTSRLVRTQVCPDPSSLYKLRIRAVNNKSLTVPNAQIVSAVKTASTTGTITTDVPHGLVTGDLVVIYGIRAQGATEFPNLTTATAVTVTGANTFTITIGTSGTITSYGGYVAKVQGGNLMSALGAVAQVVQTVSMQTLAGGTRQLAVVGSAAWAGVAIGDLVNLVGVRDNVTGATLNLDAVWKVANVSGSNLFLVPPSLGYTPPVAYPANTLGTTIDAASNGLALPQATITVVSTTGYPASGTFWVQTTTGWQLITYTGTTATTFTGCTGGTGTLFTGQPVFGVTAAGGAAIRRTDLRVSFLRLFDYERERVEVMPRPASDIAASIPVVVNNSPAVTVSSGTITTVSTVTAITGGGAAEDAAAGANPLVAGGVVRTAVAPVTLVAGDAARLTMTAGAAAVVAPYSVPEVTWQTPAPVGGIVNTATPFQVKEAAGASLCNYCTAIDLYSEALTNATDLRIREPDLTCTSQTIASNTLTVSVTHNLRIGDAVVFTASTVTGISTGVTYFVLTTPAATTITLSATRGGSTLAISGTGVTATFHKVLWQTRIPTTGASPRYVEFPIPLRGSINTAMQLQTATASGAGAVYASLQGFAAQ